MSGICDTSLGLWSILKDASSNFLFKIIKPTYSRIINSASLYQWMANTFVPMYLPNVFIEVVWNANQTATKLTDLVDSELKKVTERFLTK